MSAIEKRNEQQIDNNSKSQLTVLYEMLREIFASKFYGSVEVKFEAGKVSIVKRTESIKI